MSWPATGADEVNDEASFAVSAYHLLDPDTVVFAILAGENLLE